MQLINRIIISAPHLCPTVLGILSCPLSATTQVMGMRRRVGNLKGTLELFRIPEELYIHPDCCYRSSLRPHLGSILAPPSSLQWILQVVHARQGRRNLLSACIPNVILVEVQRHQVGHDRSEIRPWRFFLILFRFVCLWGSQG